MPPRRSARVVVSKKVVLETVHVSVVKQKKKGKQEIAYDSEAAPSLETITIEDKETPPSKTIPIEDREKEKRAAHQVPIEGPEAEPEDEPSSSVEPEAKTPAAKEVKARTTDTPESEHGAGAAEPERKEEEEQLIEAQKTAEQEVVAEADDSRKKKRRRRGRRNETTREYKTYVYRVLKQVHPELAVSSKAMTVIDNFIKDMFEKIAGEAEMLCKHSGVKTIKSREIQGAVKLVLPGELGKHAVAEGAKAVTNYMSHYKKQSKA